MAVKADYIEKTTGLKGWPDNLNAVDFDADPNNDDADCLLGGRAAHLNSTGLYTAGVAAGAMAHFLKSGINSLDTSRTAHNSHGAATEPRGRMSSLVAAGSFELATDQFDATKTYAPNDNLTSPTKAMITGDAVAKSKAGLLFKTKNWGGGSDAALVRYTDNIIAVASFGRRMTTGPAVTSPVAVGAYRRSLLAFWPVYLPSTS